MESTLSEQPNKLDECLALYKAGAGDVEIADHLGMTLRKFHELCEQNPAFAEFVERGSTVAQAWWWRQARTNLTNKSFNANMWFTNMKNRWGWADKVDTHTTIEDNKPVEELQNQLKLAVEALRKRSPELAKSLVDSAKL